MEKREEKALKKSKKNDKPSFFLLKRGFLKNIEDSSKVSKRETI